MSIVHNDLQNENLTILIVRMKLSMYYVIWHELLLLA